MLDHTKLDECLPIIDAMEKSGLFHATEMREVTRKLTYFEDTLNRSGHVSAEKTLNYVHYVKLLEDTQKRRGTENGGGVPASRQFKRFILDIFRRGLANNHDSIKLWTHLVSYSASAGARRVISRSLVRALRMNPSSAALWAYAAIWEFTGEANPFGARTVLQRGLRSCGHTGELWRQYFDLELKYTEMTRSRMQVLDPQSSESSFFTSQAGNSLSVQEGVLAASVYQAAKTHCREFHFLLHFLVATSVLPWAKRLRNYIYQDLCVEFPRKKFVLMLASSARDKIKKGVLSCILKSLDSLDDRSTFCELLMVANYEPEVSKWLNLSMHLTSRVLITRSFITECRYKNFKQVLGPNAELYSVRQVRMNDIVAFAKMHTRGTTYSSDVRSHLERCSLVGVISFSPRLFFRGEER
ncbi:hypothetical protein BE221DRAFT_142717 [Ostreococcus tauri]|uniref:U3 small nucleolar RNA-associated protein 6 N-terminal domain-containing protein n=1 Tax=Ostreococcus tauri TaxID=70448 RepID=A0A1Y5I1K7_OSTTA|nr:hypothetical protein BE221DRAFT_142717 [Ostreococcus tauri]